MSLVRTHYVDQTILVLFGLDPEANAATSERIHHWKQ
jgi:hypothetical protein